MTRRYTGGFLSSKEQVTDVNSANGVYTTQEAGALTTAGTFPTGRSTPQRSARFRNSANCYLRRLPAYPGNRKTFTTSVWVKRGVPGTTSIIWEASDATGTTVRSPLRFQSGDGLEWSDSASGGQYVTTQLFRDPSAWYHIVASIDTTQSVATNRIKLYVNGTQITSFSTATAPTLNADTLFNAAGYYNTIGSGVYWTGQAYDSNMSEFYQIDGQALDASYFGATDPETGTWVPKRYTGTYGTNGFYLPFSTDSTSYTANVLVVGGGGGGGNSGVAGGGGGAGGYVSRDLPIVSGQTYTVTVGAGGAVTTTGSNSTFGSYTGAGGGNGGIYDTINGAGNGGSGGGAGGSSGTPPGDRSGGGTLYSQGNAGGNSSGATSSGGGGGGGSASGSSAASTGSGAAGGAGYTWTVNSTVYAGGGGGGNRAFDGGTGGAGGTGGGGKGGGTNGIAVAGTPNLGGGGGGAGFGSFDYSGRAGGSGVVLIRVPDTQSLTFSAGVTVSGGTASGGYKLYTVTATSTTSETVTFS